MGIAQIFQKYYIFSMLKATAGIKTENGSRLPAPGSRLPAPGSRLPAHIVQISGLFVY
jgi:hypothetical protein